MNNPTLILLYFLCLNIVTEVVSVNPESFVPSASLSQYSSCTLIEAGENSDIYTYNIPEKEHISTTAKHPSESIYDGTVYDKDTEFELPNTFTESNNTDLTNVCAYITCIWGGLWNLGATFESIVCGAAKRLKDFTTECHVEKTVTILDGSALLITLTVAQNRAHGDKCDAPTRWKIGLGALSEVLHKYSHMYGTWCMAMHGDTWIGYFKSGVSNAGTYVGDCADPKAWKGKSYYGRLKWLPSR